jgi:hypothetical protein
MRGATGHGPRVSVWTGEGRADSAVCDRCSLCVRVPVKRATLCACAPSGEESRTSYHHDDCVTY